MRDACEAPQPRDHERPSLGLLAVDDLERYGHADDEEVKHVPYVEEEVPPARIASHRPPRRASAEPGIASERGRNVAEPLRALLDRASLFAACSAWPCTICFSVGGARGGHLELAVRRTGNPRFKPLHSAHLLEMGSGLHVRTASNG